MHYRSKLSLFSTIFSTYAHIFLYSFCKALGNNKEFTHTNTILTKAVQNFIFSTKGFITIENID
jgi:hypothetical protein